MNSKCLAETLKQQAYSFHHFNKSYSPSEISFICYQADVRFQYNLQALKWEGKQGL